MKLVLAQFSVMFSLILSLCTLTGVLTTFDLQYLWLGNWEDVPRGIIVVLSALLASINTFREDGEII